MRVGFVLALLLAIQALTPAQAGANARIPALTSDGKPNVQSVAALVTDMTTGEALYAKNADAVRAIASTGKIFVAMTVRKKGIDLGDYTEITELDRELSRGGADSRLKVGMRVKNIDLLRAMLIASDNRACSALARAVGLTPQGLVKEMNKLARELGLKKTRFTDPSGLHGNESTPREMVTGLQLVMKDPILAEIMATRDFVITAEGTRPTQIAYRNTNKVLHGSRYTILAGKTGYTDPAGYCLIVAAEIAGRKLAMALLGSSGKLTRYGDFSRIAGWLTAQK